MQRARFKQATEVICSARRIRRKLSSTNRRARREAPRAAAAASMEALAPARRASIPAARRTRLLPLLPRCLSVCRACTKTRRAVVPHPPRPRRTTDRAARITTRIATEIVIGRVTAARRATRPADRIMARRPKDTAAAAPAATARRSTRRDHRRPAPSTPAPGIDRECADHSMQNCILTTQRRFKPLLSSLSAPINDPFFAASSAPRISPPNRRDGAESDRL